VEQVLAQDIYFPVQALLQLNAATKLISIGEVPLL
jgi:hypothetical protein